STEAKGVRDLGVIYIGDREVGKTHLAMELANPDGKYVKVLRPDYEELKGILYDEELGRTRATKYEQAIYTFTIDIEVDLPTGKKEIPLDWLDTPGEIWRKSWQSSNKDEWKIFLETIQKTEGILLIVPPYREIIKSGANPEEYITQSQWCNRFERWVQFFRTDCPKVRHLLICLNKADLFCDVAQEATKLGYSPHNSQMNWQQRQSYVYQRYFRPIHPQINKLDESISGLAVRCFITSIKNRQLLELPWIYLGTFLSTN
ncbi:MAG: hypothetical protein ACOC04_06105, partial [Halothece sp.]